MQHQSVAAVAAHAKQAVHACVGVLSPVWSAPGPPGAEYSSMASRYSGATATAEISTSAPFFGRPATWIVARDGGEFLKNVA